MASIDGHWVHHLDPFLLHIHGEIGIRWYGLAYVAGIVCGYLLLARWARRDRLPLRDDEVQDFALSAGLSMIVGGRLGYCLFYNVAETIAHPLYIFQLWKGGMASHGGIIGFAIGVAWWARGRPRRLNLFGIAFEPRPRRSFLVLADAVCAVGPIGVFFGRLANFVNGELWGRPSDVPWAIIFPESGSMVPRHPSQLYAAVAEGLLIALVLLPLHARHRRPGLTTGGFFLLYAVARFSDEFFREPDNGRFLIAWLSEGQVLTIPMVFIGIALGAIAVHRPPRPELYLAPAAPDAPQCAP